MTYGYARVSTAGQGRDGNSLEDQMKSLEAYGCDEIVTEVFTGAKMERPRFAALLHKLREGDTLVVTKLDRFARTALEGCQTVRELFERGVKVHILNIGLIENTLTGNLILTVFLAFAEYERGMIVERTQTGKAVAKTRPGYQDGRPKKYKPAQIGHALSLLDSGLSYKRVEEVTGIVGHYGGFDRLAARTVISAKKCHPEVSLLILIPYHPAERPHDRSYTGLL